MSEHIYEPDPVDTAEKAIRDELAFLTDDQQHEVIARLGLRRAGELAVAETTRSIFDRDEYDLTIAAIKLLVSEDSIDEPMPDFDEIHANASIRSLFFLQEHIRNGGQPELTIHLPVGLEDLDLSKSIYKDIQSPQGWGEVWHAYTDRAHNLPRRLLEPGIMLGDRIDPEHSAMLANPHKEVGLVYVTKTYQEQVASFNKENRLAAEKGVELNPITISQYLVIQAKHLLAGKPLMDETTATRFIQYPGHLVGEKTKYSPTAGSGDAEELTFSAIREKDFANWLGIRRVVTLQSENN